MVQRLSIGRSDRNFLSSAGASFGRARAYPPRRGFGGHHIGACAAGDHARIHRDAALRVGEPGDPLDLPGQLQNGARTGSKSTPACDGPARDRYCVVAHAFARGLQFPVETRARLQNQHRRALRAASSVSGRDDSLPTSSSRIQLQHHLAADRKIQLPQRLASQR